MLAPRTQATRDDWREATWDEALKLVTDRFAATAKQARSGCDGGLLLRESDERGQLRAAKNVPRGHRHEQHRSLHAGLCHAGSVVALQFALGSSAMSNTASEIYQNDVTIITGSNTAETHPIIALQMKDAAMHHGTQIIVARRRLHSVPLCRNRRECADHRRTRSAGENSEYKICAVKIEPATMAELEQTPQTA